jgi:glutathione synthase/RimK-type ligase-like ATP-grasp enzyme
MTHHAHVPPILVTELTAAPPPRGDEGLIVSDDEPPEPRAGWVGARRWLTDPALQAHRGPVLNAAAPGDVYGVAYTVSLLADARGLRVRPSLADVLRVPAPAAASPGDEVGILVEPDSILAPSNPGALDAFTRAFERRGRRVRRLEVGAAEPLDGLCALLVRATTRTVGPVAELIARAHARGIALLEPPEVVARCCNKAWQAERFARAGLPTPATRLGVPGQEAELIGALGLPCVVKIPDSSGGQGVFRATSPSGLRSALERVAQGSAVAVVQAFVPSAFDWRIGLIDGVPLYASRYEMVQGHWQIHLWEGDGLAAVGADRALPLDRVPVEVLAAAVGAARAVGGGLLGVDLKLVDGRPFVIEVNDTPTIFAGDEDAVAGPGLYEQVADALLARVRGQG